MNEKPSDTDFAERLLEVIDSGRRTATYKLALLLALIDLCAKSTDESGQAPEMLFTRDIADQVAALYWPQVVPFSAVGPDAIILKQISLPRSTIVDAVAKFRQSADAVGVTSFHLARRLAPVPYEFMVDRVEVAVAEQPLPRLQTVGSSERQFPFLYDLEWGTGENISLRRLRATGDSRGAPIRLRPGASDHLVRLSPLLRPLIELHWVRMVADLNRIARVESSLHDHLFGKERIPLPGAIRTGLLGLQNGRCFYCHDKLNRTDADHFLPRVRSGLDSIENLILADSRCNGDKSDLFASPRLVRRWAERNQTHFQSLQNLAFDAGWESDPLGTVGMARALYGHLPYGERPFWNGIGDITLASPRDAIRALAAA
jgi:5-methylcytosine-specific restriction endonuclease McrA